LRAGLCDNLQALDNYPWCGHSELLGHTPGIGLAADVVLPLFGRRKGNARKAYREFIADGLDMGKRPDLTGGGLLRSRQGEDAGEFQDSDERVLGSGDFVASLRQEGHLKLHVRQKIDLPIIEQEIARHFDLPHLRQRGRQNSASHARAVFCYWAVRAHGHTAAEVGRYLGIGTPSVSRSVRQGGALAAGDAKLRAMLERSLKQ
jgi:hypothetical protein